MILKKKQPILNYSHSNRINAKCSVTITVINPTSKDSEIENRLSKYNVRTEGILEEDNEYQF